MYRLITEHQVHQWSSAVVFNPGPGEPQGLIYVIGSLVEQRYPKNALLGKDWNL